MFSYFLYRGERKQRKADAEAYERRQAGLVMAWTEPGGRQLVLYNGSDRPITNCVIMYRTLASNLPNDGAGGIHRLWRQEFVIIRPHDQLTPTVVENADASPGTNSPLYMRFVDGGGRHWFRDRKLNLHEVSPGEKLPPGLAPELEQWLADMPDGPKPLS